MRSKEEDFLDLSVEVEQNTSITHCLQAFSNTETLCSECKYYCEVCCSKQEAQKRWVSWMFMQFSGHVVKPVMISMSRSAANVICYWPYLHHVMHWSLIYFTKIPRNFFNNLQFLCHRRHSSRMEKTSPGLCPSKGTAVWIFIVTRLQRILPPKMSFFFCQKVQISSKILPQILLNIGYPELLLFCLNHTGSWQIINHSTYILQIINILQCHMVKLMT